MGTRGCVVNMPWTPPPYPTAPVLANGHRVHLGGGLRPSAPPTSQCPPLWLCLSFPTAMERCIGGGEAEHKEGSSPPSQPNAGGPNPTPAAPFTPHPPSSPLQFIIAINAAIKAGSTAAHSYGNVISREPRKFYQILSEGS